MNCKCGNIVPIQRTKLGYTTCKNCSNEERWSANPLTFHKTGNTIEVIKDPELAREVHFKAQRNSFGVCQGMKSGYTPKKRKEEDVKRIIPSDREFSKVISKRKVDPSLYRFEEVCEASIDMFNEGKTAEEINSYLSSEIQGMRISPVHKKRIQQMIYLMSKTKKGTIEGSSV
jgi:hypothetical protein